MTRLALILCLLLAPPALAQDHTRHSGPAMADSPAAAAFAEVNARMHQAMNLPFTGNADADFLTAMIPHHQGAIDMAEVVLEHGSDPEVRALAEEIIAAQEAEIAEMQALLAQLGR